MKNDEDELIDTIIGEAVIAMLDANGPVNSKALIAELESLGRVTTDPLRLSAINRAISDIQVLVSDYRRVSQQGGPGKEERPGFTKVTGDILRNATVRRKH